MVTPYWLDPTNSTVHHLLLQRHLCLFNSRHELQNLIRRRHFIILTAVVLVELSCPKALDITLLIRRHNLLIGTDLPEHLFAASIVL